MTKLGVALALSLLACLSLGCARAEEQGEAGGEASQALNASGPVLGFEDASTWQGLAVTSSELHTEGSRSLSVSPRGYTLYRSASFDFEGQLREIALDLRLPLTQPNPYWLGALQVYLTCPARQLSNAFVGQVELTGLPRGQFTTLELAVPSQIRLALQGSAGCPALSVGLALNVPGAPGVYLLDNLRLRSELLLRYELEGSGSVAIDTSGYDHHGTLVGGASLVGEGHEGGAVQLDGLSGHVELPAGIWDEAEELTIATWVELDALSAWSRVFDFGGPGGFFYLTPATHDQLLRYSAFTSFAREGTVTGAALNVGAWKHLAVTSKGRDYRVYIDGIEAAAALGVAVTPADVGSGLGQWLGRSRFPDPYLAGKLDDFRIYDRALSQSEIAALARHQADYAHYSFEETAGSVIDDTSGLDLDGQLVGAGSREPGLIGQALRLSGAGDHVRLPAGIVQACPEFWFGGWLKLRENRPWNRVFDFGNPDFSGFMFLSPAGFGAAGQELRFGLVSPAGADDLGFPYAMPLEEWTHVGVSVASSTATLFLNGRAVARRPGLVSDPTDLGATLQNTFGKSLFPDPGFAGALDDLRFGCRPLDAREQQQFGHLPLPSPLPNQRPLTGDLQHVHDPALIAASDGYHLFSTGPGILTRFSPTLEHVTFTGQVFSEHPAWVTERFGVLDSLWAPDVSFFGGSYHLYYSASTFGSNRSCIGHATKLDLATGEPWSDHGPVLCSNFDSVDDFNAIDPNIVLDEGGTPWLSFGSFWSGIKLARLTSTGERADEALVDLARGPGTAVEAPFIVYRAPYYYLFVSFDFCCRGVDSSYRVVVGRSRSVAGPYLDRTGLPLLDEGGTPVVSGSSRFRGPGHNAVFELAGQTYQAYHAYDADNAGVPTLRVSELTWQEGWPVSAEP